MDFVVDVANEQSVILGVLATPADAEPVLRRVSPGEFLDSRHVLVWTAFRAALDQRQWYQPAAVRRIIADAGGDLDSYLAGLEKLAEVAPPADLPRCVETLRWDSRRHAVLTEGMPQLRKALLQGSAEPSSVRALAARVAESLSSVAAADFVGADQVVNEYAADLHRRRRQGVYGLGYPAFDDLLGRGFAPGLTTVVSGVSSAGKSSVLMNWAMRLAEQGRRVAYCAWEETHLSLADIIAAADPDDPIDYQSLQRGSLDDATRRRAVERVRRYTDVRQPGWIRFVRNPFTRAMMASGKIHNTDNYHTIDAIVAESGADVVIYDMLERAYAERQIQAVEQMLEMVQDMHKVRDVHGIVGAQTNLEVVERANKKSANRSDVKGSKRIVEIADIFINLYREGQFLVGDADNVLTTTCDKQRHGRSPWRVDWHWEGCYKRISSPRLHGDEQLGVEPRDQVLEFDADQAF